MATDTAPIGAPRLLHTSTSASTLINDHHGNDPSGTPSVLPPPALQPLEHQYSPALPGGEESASIRPDRYRNADAYTGTDRGSRQSAEHAVPHLPQGVTTGVTTDSKTADKAQESHSFQPTAGAGTISSPEHLERRAVTADMQPPEGSQMQWELKQVTWQGYQRRIVMQNENGPCSLIALANVLILRGEVTITPASRTATTYGHLASLLAEHLLTRAAERGPEAEADVTAAFTALPFTQTGLDVNVCFDACDSFAPAAPGSAGGGDGARALFELAGVRLVHGWLPDQDDTDVTEALRRVGDYDSALSLIAEADSLSSGAVVESASSSSGVHGRELDPQQRQKISDGAKALALRKFFDTSATQLTYVGLFALAQTLLPGELAAFFRNSHVSVIYRRESRPGLEGEAPLLYMLATDAAMLLHKNVVWESLADVDQAASEFFDGSLCVTRTRDFVGSNERVAHTNVPAHTRTGSSQERDSIPVSETQNDALLAQRLQEEEYGTQKTAAPPPRYSPDPWPNERRTHRASGRARNSRNRPFRPQPPPAPVDVPRPGASIPAEAAVASPKRKGKRASAGCLIM